MHITIINTTKNLKNVMSLLKVMQTLQMLLLHLYRYFSGKMVRNCTHFAHLIGKFLPYFASIILDA